MGCDHTWGFISIQLYGPIIPQKLHVEQLPRGWIYKVELNQHVRCKRNNEFKWIARPIHTNLYPKQMNKFYLIPRGIKIIDFK
jgi:hypothetical protein